MPNWCQNDLIVIGDSYSIEEFDKVFRGKKKKKKKYVEVTFNGTPYKIKGPIEITYNGLGYDEGYSLYNFSKEERIDDENWYDRNLKNIGTKWDIFDDDVVTTKRYNFCTAWSPCSENIIREMSEEFPDLQFVHSYEEGGMVFAGKNVYRKGKNTYKEYHNDGKSYRKFCEKNDLDDYPYICGNCGLYISDWEMDDNDDKCPECNSDNIIEL